MKNGSLNYSSDDLCFFVTFEDVLLHEILKVFFQLHGNLFLLLIMVENCGIIFSTFVISLADCGRIMECVEEIA